MQQGWHRAAVKLLDRLLAAGCLLRADFTAAAAVQLLSMPPATLEAAMPGDEMMPRLMHACALRALQNFSPPADISLQVCTDTACFNVLSMHACAGPQRWSPL